MPPSGEFGVNQRAVERHLKAPAIGGDQRDRFDFGFILPQEISRQTGGPIGVVSDRAVLDGNVEQHNGLLWG